MILVAAEDQVRIQVLIYSKILWREVGIKQGLLKKEQNAKIVQEKVNTVPVAVKEPTKNHSMKKLIILVERDETAARPILLVVCRQRHPPQYANLRL